MSTMNRQALPVKTDRSFFFTDLAYMPSDFKERRIWMGQSIIFAKRNSEVLVDYATVQKYRLLAQSKINEQTYKEIIDPKTPMGGGTADKFSADWKALPIDIHLDNIIEATIEKVPQNLSCKVVDPMAKLQEQKDKEKIINQQRVRMLINGFVSELGLSVKPIGENEDPYKWIEKFSNKDADKMIDTVGSPVDQIRSRIKDDKALRLFMKFVYKNGIEIALEQAIQYYLIDQNKWDIHGEDFLKDLKHFNRACGRYYVDLTTGRGRIEYIEPFELYTSPFNRRDGEDIVYWFREKDVTFAEFERQVGAELTDEDKKNIFNYFKSYATSHGNDYQELVGTPTGRRKIAASKIRLGFYSVLTQEAESFSEGYMNVDVRGDTTPPIEGWEDTESNRTIKQENKVYNVWYSCYYLPMNPNGENNALTGYEWQARHVYRIEKNVDMYRYGVDGRFAKSELVVWKDLTRPSFSEIKERFMPKINTSWHKFQNCLVNDVQAMISDVDLITGMIAAVDEGNKESRETNKNAYLEEIRSLKQSGQAWLKFRDRNGQKLQISPKDLFVAYDNGMLEKGEKHLMQILVLYDLMTRSLAMTGPGEGMTPKPRTPLGGLNLAQDAGDNNIYYIEKTYKHFLIMFAEREVNRVKCICSEKHEFHYEERYKELEDVVGWASYATLEGLEKVPLSNIGLVVTQTDTAALKELVNTIASNMVTQKEITPGTLELILATENWKLALYELAIEQEDREAEMAKQRQAEFDQAMALKQKDLEIAQALLGAKTQGVNSNIQVQGQVDAQLQAQENNLKAQTMAGLADQRNAHKQSEDVLNSDLKKQEEEKKRELEDQSAY